MKKIHLTYILLGILCLQSCQTVNQYSFDYLTPAEISFPVEIRKVAVVNNTNVVPGMLIVPDTQEEVNATLARSLKEYLLTGDPVVTVNALAQALADENYFDKVTVADSVIRDHTSKTLSREEVRALTSELDADLIISLEQLIFQVTHKISLEEVYRGVTDVIVYPQFRLYIPERNNKLTTIQVKDSIFWENYFHYLSDAWENMPSNEQITIEASNFAGEISAKHLVPTWETTQRFLYPGGSSELRDGAFFVNNNDWEKALRLWEKAYNQKSGRVKARAASNISLYYEMKDDFFKAEEWNEKALELFKTLDKPTQKVIDVSAEVNNDYGRTAINNLNLQKRKNNFSKLKIQMERFNNETPTD